MLRAAKNAVMNNFNVAKVANVFSKAGNVITTSIVKVARTNTIAVSYDLLDFFSPISSRLTSFSLEFKSRRNSHRE